MKVDYKKVLIIGAIAAVVSAGAWVIYRSVKGESYLPDIAQPVLAQAGSTSYQVLEQITRQRIASSPISTAGYAEIILERWLNDPREVRYVVAPAGARPINLIKGTNVGPFNGRVFNKVDYLRWLRQTLDEAGHRDVDVRAYALLVGVETAWGRIVYDWNLGNHKAQGSVYGTNRSDAFAGRNLRTTIQGATHIFLLRDRVRLPSGWIGSVDAYPGYASRRDGMQAHIRVFNGARYQGAMDALRRGGQEGLETFESILGRAGYSGAPVAARIARARWYWRNYSNVPNWENRQLLNESLR